MRLILLLLRVYGYTVHAALSLAALAMSAVIVGSPHDTVTIGWLPWTAEHPGAWLAGLGVLGIALVALAGVGRRRWLLAAYSAAVTGLIASGLFFSSWQFSGPAEFRQAVWIFLGLLLAFMGTIPIRTVSR